MAARYFLRNSASFSKQFVLTRTFSSSNACCSSLPSIEKLTSLAAKLPKEHQESFQKLMAEYNALEHRAPDSPFLPQDAAAIISSRCNIQEGSAEHKKVLEAVKSIKTYKDFAPVLEQFTGPDQTHSKFPTEPKEQINFLSNYINKELELEDRLPGYLKGWQFQPISSSVKLDTPSSADIDVESFEELEERMRSLSHSFQTEMSKVEADRKELEMYLEQHGHFPPAVQQVVNDDIAKKLEQFEEMNHEEVNYEPYWIDRTRVDLERREQRDRRLKHRE